MITTQYGPREHSDSMMTPWGWSQAKDRIAPGVLSYSTAGHGGLVVGTAVALKHLSDRTLGIGQRWGSCFAFEEDCAVLAPLYDMPEWYRVLYSHSPRLQGMTDDQIRADLLPSLDRWYPEWISNTARGAQIRTLLMDIKSLRVNDLVCVDGNDMQYRLIRVGRSITGVHNGCRFRIPRPRITRVIRKDQEHATM